MSTTIPHQALENEDERLYSTPIFRSTAPARRTPSFSSSDSSSFSCSSDSQLLFSPPFSPSTPLKYEGIPFSWEKIPGIAKAHQIPSKENADSLLGCLVPPPPARNSNPSAKKTMVYREKKDPFYAALLQCSKDDDEDDVDGVDGHDLVSRYGNSNIFKGSSKITRTLSDRFGMMSMVYGSCKSTCAVSDSVVYVPRLSRNRYPHYLLRRRRRSS